jgi:transcriptional regulator with XRE-family HTH domain
MTSRRPPSKLVWRAHYEVFRQRLVAARKAAGLSQTEVARAIGKPQAWVSQCETGERRVDLVEAAILAALYKKTLKYFAPFSSPSLRSRS